MPEPQAPPSETLLDAIPDPDTVRRWLARTIRQAALLRGLLRLAERKAHYAHRAPVPQEGINAE